MITRLPSHWLLVVAAALLATGCSGGSGGDGGANASSSTPGALGASFAAISLSPATPSLPVGATQQFTARATDSKGATVSDVTFIWSSSNPAVAAIDSRGLATGLAPGAATITAGAAGVSSQPVVLTVTNQVAGAPNALPVTLGTDLNNGVNRPMVSVKVCLPGSTSQCTTISNIILDSGSTGLRIMKSAVTLSLPHVSVPAQVSQNLPGGSLLAECYPFVTSNAWGTVHAADLYLGGEPALASASLHLMDSTFGNGPPLNAGTGVGSGCATNGFDLLTMSNLRANGILGVLPMQYDNKPAGNLAPANEYWACVPGGNCTLLEGTVPGLAPRVSKGALQLVANPVFSLPADNNGLIFQFPAVPDTGAVSAEGTLLLGIGTAGNNQVPSGMTLLAFDPFARVTVSYNQQIMGAPGAVPIDTGNPVTDFSASALAEPLCTLSGIQTLLCPFTTKSFPVGLGSIQSLSTNRLSSSLLVGNAQSLLVSSGNRLFNNLVNDSSFPALGLPFFLGKTVYMAFPSATYPYGYVAF